MPAIRGSSRIFPVGAASSITGPIGNIGPTGGTGATGPTGSTGPIGVMGTYIVATGASGGPGNSYGNDFITFFLSDGNTIGVSGAAGNVGDDQSTNTSYRIINESEALEHGQLLRLIDGSTAEFYSFTISGKDITARHDGDTIIFHGATYDFGVLGNTGEFVVGASADGVLNTHYDGNTLLMRILNHREIFDNANDNANSDITTKPVLTDTIVNPNKIHGTSIPFLKKQNPSEDGVDVPGAPGNTAFHSGLYLGQTSDNEGNSAGVYYEFSGITFSGDYGSGNIIRPFGSCCYCSDGEDGTPESHTKDCINYVTEDYCDSVDGIFSSLECLQSGCFDTGSCCVNGECTASTEETCEKYGGFYIDNLRCGEIYDIGGCPASCGFNGACCVNGVCINTDELGCDYENGIYFPDTSCDSTVPVFAGSSLEGTTYHQFCCDQECRGACCLEEICYDTTAAQCSALIYEGAGQTEEAQGESNGVFWGVGSVCAGPDGPYLWSDDPLERTGWFQATQEIEGLPTPCLHSTCACDCYRPGDEYNPYGLGAGVGGYIDYILNETNGCLPPDHEPPECIDNDDCEPGKCCDTGIGECEACPPGSDCRTDGCNCLAACCNQETGQCDDGPCSCTSDSECDPDNNCCCEEGLCGKCPDPPGPCECTSDSDCSDWQTDGCIGPVCIDELCQEAPEGTNGSCCIWCNEFNSTACQVLGENGDEQKFNTPVCVAVGVEDPTGTVYDGTEAYCRSTLGGHWSGTDISYCSDDGSCLTGSCCAASGANVIKCRPTSSAKDCYNTSKPICRYLETKVSYYVWNWEHPEHPNYHPLRRLLLGGVFNMAWNPVKCCAPEVTSCGENPIQEGYASQSEEDEAPSVFCVPNFNQFVSPYAGHGWGGWYGGEIPIQPHYLDIPWTDLLPWDWALTYNSCGQKKCMEWIRDGETNPIWCHTDHGGAGDDINGWQTLCYDGFPRDVERRKDGDGTPWQLSGAPCWKCFSQCHCGTRWGDPDCPEWLLSGNGTPLGWCLSPWNDEPGAPPGGPLAGAQTEDSCYMITDERPEGPYCDPDGNFDPDTGECDSILHYEGWVWWPDHNADGEGRAEGICCRAGFNPMSAGSWDDWFDFDCNLWYAVSLHGADFDPAKVCDSGAMADCCSCIPEGDCFGPDGCGGDCSGQCLCPTPSPGCGEVDGYGGVCTYLGGHSLNSCHVNTPCEMCRVCNHGGSGYSPFNGQGQSDYPEQRNFPAGTPQPPQIPSGGESGCGTIILADGTCWSCCSDSTHTGSPDGCCCVDGTATVQNEDMCMGSGGYFYLVDDIAECDAFDFCEGACCKDNTLDPEVANCCHEDITDAVSANGVFDCNENIGGDVGNWVIDIDGTDTTCNNNTPVQWCYYNSDTAQYDYRENISAADCENDSSQCPWIDNPNIDLIWAQSEDICGGIVIDANIESCCYCGNDPSPTAEEYYRFSDCAGFERIECVNDQLDEYCIGGIFHRDEDCEDFRCEDPYATKGACCSGPSTVPPFQCYVANNQVECEGTEGDETDYKWGGEGTKCCVENCVNNGETCCGEDDEECDDGFIEQREGDDDVIYDPDVCAPCCFENRCWDHDLNAPIPGCVGDMPWPTPEDEWEERPCICKQVCCTEGEMYNVSPPGEPPVMLMCSSIGWQSRWTTRILEAMCIHEPHATFGGPNWDPARGPRRSRLAGNIGDACPNPRLGGGPDVGIDEHTCCFDSLLVHGPETPSHQAAHSPFEDSLKWGEDESTCINCISLWEMGACCDQQQGQYDGQDYTGGETMSCSCCMDLPLTDCCTWWSDEIDGCVPPMEDLPENHSVGYCPQCAAGCDDTYFCNADDFCKINTEVSTDEYATCSHYCHSIGGKFYGNKFSTDCSVCGNWERRKDIDAGWCCYRNEETDNNECRRVSSPYECECAVYNGGFGGVFHREQNDCTKNCKFDSLKGSCCTLTSCQDDVDEFECDGMWKLRTPCAYRDCDITQRNFIECTVQDQYTNAAGCDNATNSNLTFHQGEAIEIYDQADGGDDEYLSNNTAPLVPYSCVGGICTPTCCEDGSGEGCTTNDDCTVGYCCNGTCKDSCDGEPCTNDNNCGDGTCCVNSICKTGNCEGTTCTYNTDCAGSLLCCEGTCHYQSDCCEGVECSDKEPYSCGRCDDEIPCIEGQCIDVGACCKCSEMDGAICEDMTQDACEDADGSWFSGGRMCDDELWPGSTFGIGETCASHPDWFGLDCIPPSCTCAEYGVAGATCQECYCCIECGTSGVCPDEARGYTCDDNEGLQAQGSCCIPCRDEWIPDTVEHPGGCSPAFTGCLAAGGSVHAGVCGGGCAGNGSQQCCEFLQGEGSNIACVGAQCTGGTPCESDAYCGGDCITCVNGCCDCIHGNNCDNVNCGCP